MHQLRLFLLPADDPLADRTSVTLADLSGRLVVDVPPECSRVWWNFCAVDPRPDGTPVRYGPIIQDGEALFLAVSRGQATAFLPAPARDFFPRPGVRYIDVPDLPPSTAALAWMAKNRSLPTITAMRNAARAVLRSRTTPSTDQ